MYSTELDEDCHQIASLVIQLRLLPFPLTLHWTSSSELPIFLARRARRGRRGHKRIVYLEHLPTGRVRTTASQAIRPCGLTDNHDEARSSLERQTLDCLRRSQSPAALWHTVLGVHDDSARFRSDSEQRLQCIKRNGGQFPIVAQAVELRQLKR